MYTGIIGTPKKAISAFYYQYTNIIDYLYIATLYIIKTLAHKSFQISEIEHMPVNKIF